MTTTNGNPKAVPPPQPARVPGDTTPRACRDELDVLIRARYPLIYVVSWEEERVEQQLSRIAASRNKKLFVWTYTQGIVKYGSEPQRAKSGNGSTADPLAALDSVLADVDPAIYLFKDFHPFTEEHRSNLAIIRRLKDVAYHLRNSYKTIVIVSPFVRLAPELMKDVTLVEMPPPGVEDFSKLLDRIKDDLKDKPQIRINLDNEAKEKLLHAASGLTMKEAENVFAKTLVLDGKIDADDISVVFSEKQQIIRKSGLLEYYASDERFSSVGGLDNVKLWLEKRTSAFTDRARAFGLPPPRGMLLLGIQGCGKSLCAKAASGLWKLPLLRFSALRHRPHVWLPRRLQRREHAPRHPDQAESVAPCHPLGRRNRQGLLRIHQLRRLRRRHRRLRLRHLPHPALRKNPFPRLRHRHRQRHLPPPLNSSAKAAPSTKLVLRRPPHRGRTPENPDYPLLETP